MNKFNINDVNPVSKNIEYIYNQGIKLALHSWTPRNPKAILFYIHGIQSHAGWSVEMANKIAPSSIAVYILDRRGAGISGGLRGDIPSAEILLIDYYLALIKIKQQYPTLPITFLGHSLGGSILAGLLSWSKFDINYRSAIFCSSALGKLHHQLSPLEQNQLLNDRSMDLHELNLNDHDYTDDPSYLVFMKQDDLCCRKITQRSRAALLEIEKLYWKKPLLHKNTSSVYVHPLSDPLVNINNAIDVFMQLTNNQGITFQLPANHHYLWFTDQKDILTNWLIHYVLTGGYKYNDNR